jgi:hypothetical protein
MLKMLPNMALRQLGWRFVWTVYFKSTVKTENIEEAFEDGMNKKVVENDDVEYAAKHGIEKTWVEIRVYVENIVKTEHFVTVFSTSTRTSTSIFPMPCLEASSTSSVLTISNSFCFQLHL